jgi:hypothetical protein
MNPEDPRKTNAPEVGNQEKVISLAEGNSQVAA